MLVPHACPGKVGARLQFQSSPALHLLVVRGRRAARGQYRLCGQNEEPWSCEMGKSPTTGGGAPVLALVGAVSPGL